MKTDHQPEPTPAVFLQTVSVAVTQLKHQLQQDYEQAYPDLREIIHLVLDEEETNAWELSLFPHLFLPDLVEAHIANLNLQPAETLLREATARQAAHDPPSRRHSESFRERGSATSNQQPVLALCG
ncbi:MAG: hypothetical protein ABR514_11030 [Chthoniobacterales bacterium]